MNGSRELTRGATAYLASLTFAMTYLASSARGATALTALTRGVVVAIATWFLGRALLRPAMAQIVAAMARDRAEGAAAASHGSPAEDAE